MTVAPTVC